MFKAIQKNNAQTGAESTPEYLTLSIDQQSYQIPVGYSVTAALLSTGHNSNRYSSISGKKRGPYCLMGVCFECLCQIDGVANRQGCMTLVTPGMQIEHQQGSGDIQGITVIDESIIDQAVTDEVITDRTNSVETTRKNIVIEGIKPVFKEPKNAL